MASEQSAPDQPAAHLHRLGPTHVPRPLAPEQLCRQRGSRHVEPP